MKWFTSLNAAALGAYAEDLRAAISSALATGRLEPHVLFDGEPADLYRTIGHDRFTLHQRSSGLAADIARIPDKRGWSQAIARGTYLRLEVGWIENDDPYVLYSDIDTLFVSPIDLAHLKPRFLAAAPGDNRHDWRDFCAGVMLINVAALREQYGPLMECARRMLGETPNYDQDALNVYFSGRWDRLELRDHWKPYWGVNPGARIVHFHGPKPRHARELLSNSHAQAETPEVYRRLFGQSPDGYAYYTRLAEIAARTDPTPSGQAQLRVDWRAVEVPQPEKATTGAIRAVRRAIGRIRRIPAGNAAGAELALSNDMERATRENFDEDSYLLLNADVAEAVRAGHFTSGWSHFLLYGLAEKRAQFRPVDPLATPETFDERAYLARNPDVALMIAAGRYRDARAHFLKRGSKERRRQTPTGHFRGFANGCVDDNPPSTA
mgnify:CR=1 FL=1